MRRTLLIALTILTTAAMTSAQLGGRRAQRQGGQEPTDSAPHGREGFAPHHGGPHDGPGPGEFLQALRELGLTDQQREQIAETLQAHREQVRQFGQEHAQAVAEAHRALRQARRDEDPEAVEQARAELESLMDQRRQLHEQLRESLAEILSEEQLARLEALVGPASRVQRFMEAVRGLDLTDEQREQIDQIAERVRNALEGAESRPDKARLLGRGHHAIMEILTPQQRRELHRQLRGRDADRLHDRIAEALEMTDEQAEQFSQAARDFREALAGADDRQGRREAIQQFHQQLESFLSDEQLETLRQIHQRMRRLGAGPGGDEDAPERPGPRGAGESTGPGGERGGRQRR
jgi:Spy/CpxP family protein refolding chaperone